MVSSYTLPLALTSLSFGLLALVSAKEPIKFTSFVGCEDREHECTVTDDNSWPEFDRPDQDGTRLVPIDDEYNITWRDHDEDTPVRIAWYFEEDAATLTGPAGKEVPDYIKWEKSE